MRCPFAKARAYDSIKGADMRITVDDDAHEPLAHVLRDCHVIRSMIGFFWGGHCLHPETGGSTANSQAPAPTTSASDAKYRKAVGR